MKTDKEEIAKNSFPILFFCFGVFGLPAAASVYFGDYVLAGVLIAVGVGCLIGFRTGALKAVSSIALIVAAIYFSPQLLPYVEPKLNEWFEFSGLWNRIAAFVAIFFGIGLLLTITVSLLTWMFLEKESTLDRSNKFLGMMIGGAEATLAAVLLLGGIQVVEPMLKPAQPKKADAAFANLSDITFDTLADVSERTKTSLVGPILEEHNPFTKYPEYNPLPKVKRTVQLLSDPSRINDLLNEDGTLENIQASPAFAEAVNKLSLDPAMQKILSSNKPPSLNDIIELMKSESVLEILDEPGFMEEATRIFNESPALADELSAAR
jgi:uncharacterized membrane protein required for colicin V production